MHDEYDYYHASRDNPMSPFHSNYQTSVNRTFFMSIVLLSIFFAVATNGLVSSSAFLLVSVLYLLALIMVLGILWILLLSAYEIYDWCRV